MGKRIGRRTGAAAFARRWQMRRSRPRFFYLLLPFNVCRDYGKAKIWVGETSTALVFVLSYFFYAFFLAFIFVRFGRNIWNIDKQIICEYANARSKVFLLRQ